MATLVPVKLVIVHYHLRPGGIRRIIELATPQMIRNAPCPITRIVLATGQRADRRWHHSFARQLPGVAVEVFLEPAFNYLSEQPEAAQRITLRLQSALARLLAGADAENCLVWAHNLGVGRNLLLSRELAAACVARQIPLVSHHHDWWFDNRWLRWREMRAAGFRTLAAAARAVFPQSGQVAHAAINQADASVLIHHFPQAAFWLPNLAEPTPPPAQMRIRAARQWLKRKLAHGNAPVWLLPCRTLRRKNIAEALLLTRWLRPEAWLVVTGGASSAEELPYFQALEQAAHQHRWRLRLGVLAGKESRQPAVGDLLAASESLLLTSVQEGFGLPYLEAAAAQRPLIARRLPNIAPDLDQFGFGFPQAYDEILVAPTLFAWTAEQARQKKLFRQWRANLPGTVRGLVPRPAMLAATQPVPVSFSRLTLTAQLEVLAHPAAVSWAACAALNPFLEKWRQRARSGQLEASAWPQGAKRWLGGAAYAQRFFAAAAAPATSPRCAGLPEKVQGSFIHARLTLPALYPLLWNIRT